MEVRAASYQALEAGKDCCIWHASVQEWQHEEGKGVAVGRYNGGCSNRCKPRKPLNCVVGDFDIIKDETGALEDGDAVLD